MSCIQNSCIDRPTPFTDEINFNIFSKLNEDDLETCCRVSKSWHKVASNAYLWNAFNLRKISPLLKIFDASDWVNHVDLSSFKLDLTDAPPLNKRKAIPFLKRCLSSLPIEGNAGITFLPIPKGLTFNKLVELAGSPKVGNTPKFRFIWCSIVNKIGDVPVDETYWLVITNNVFKKRLNLSDSDQAKLSKIGLPTVLEATALLVVTFMVSGERLYGDNPWTYTYCLERLSDYQSVVGGFSQDGVYVNGYNLPRDTDGCAAGVLRLARLL